MSIQNSVMGIINAGYLGEQRARARDRQSKLDKAGELFNSGDHRGARAMLVEANGITPGMIDQAEVKKVYDKYRPVSAAFEGPIDGGRNATRISAMTEDVNKATGTGPVSSSFMPNTGGNQPAGAMNFGSTPVVSESMAPPTGVPQQAPAGPVSSAFEKMGAMEDPAAKPGGMVSEAFGTDAGARNAMTLPDAPMIAPYMDPRQVQALQGYADRADQFEQMAMEFEGIGRQDLAMEHAVMAQQARAPMRKMQQDTARFFAESLMTIESPEERDRVMKSALDDAERLGLKINPHTKKLIQNDNLDDNGRAMEMWLTEFGVDPTSVKGLIPAEVSKVHFHNGHMIKEFSDGTTEREALPMTDQQELELELRAAGIEADLRKSGMSFDIGVDENGNPKISIAQGGAVPSAVDPNDPFTGDKVSDPAVVNDPERGAVVTPSAQQQKFLQDYAGVRDTRQQVSMMRETIADAKKRVNSWTAGTHRGLTFLDYANQPGVDLTALLEELGGQIALENLIDLKSKGGTMGALNEKEFDSLANQLGSLRDRMSAPLLRQKLDQVDEQLAQLETDAVDMQRKRYPTLQEQFDFEEGAFMDLKAIRNGTKPASEMTNAELLEARRRRGEEE